MNCLNNKIRRIPLCCRWAKRTSIRTNTTRNSPKKYIDQWFEYIVKPATFYEENAAPGVKRKNYFYTVDLQGRVFLEETLPKNIATCIKNLEFLDFFFRRLRRVNEGEREILRQLHAQDDYPFVSPCGPELNFVRPADLPIVFHSINDGKDGSKELVFGGSMVQPFCPDRLAISRVSGRLYHELIDPDGDDGEDSESLRRKVGDRSTPLHKSEEIEYGLIRSSVAVLLSDSITVGRDEESETHSGMDFVSSDSDTKRYPIEFLALHAEPGPWKLPFIDGDAD